MAPHPSPGISVRLYHPRVPPEVLPVSPETGCLAAMKTAHLFFSLIKTTSNRRLQRVKKSSWHICCALGAFDYPADIFRALYKWAAAPFVWRVVTVLPETASVPPQSWTWHCSDTCLCALGEHLFKPTHVLFLLPQESKIGRTSPRKHCKPPPVMPASSWHHRLHTSCSQEETCSVFFAKWSL